MSPLSFQPENSKAVLIGIGEFEYSLDKFKDGFAAVPIAANFKVMEEVLRKKLSINDITPLENTPNLISAVNKTLNGQAQWDTLFVYFSGHGFYHNQGLSLALPDSIPNRAASGVAFKDLFEEFKNKATHTVFILDCCYSANVLLPNIKNRPLFLLAAASSKDTAKNSPDKTQPTPFTAAFCKLLQHGSAQGEEFFTLQSVSNYLKNKELSDLEVEPVYVEHSDKGSSLRLCQNPVFKPKRNILRLTLTILKKRLEIDISLSLLSLLFLPSTPVNDEDIDKPHPPKNQ